MPKRSAEYMEQRRRHILDATLQCYLERGFDGMSLADICKAAEISMGAFYKHFKTKREAMIAVVDRTLSDSIVSEVNSFKAFRQFMIDAVVEFDGERRCEHARIDYELINISLRDEELHKRTKRAVLVREEQLLAIMKTLQESGEIDPSYDVNTGAKTLNMLMSGLWITNVIAPDTSAKSYLPCVLAELGKMTG
ncbi:TetR/AcrR family transcriptional regulator [Kordiimonas sp.]|uniref:TetR/AcrR family transcriptional regulator n=1 Tax=Kordiimonas sp. TaxID=1970157 RepID=UPI003A8D1B6D